MGITQCFIMALKSLSTSKMRALLTMLGIIIGVAAVILIMSMGNGLQVYINDMFAEIGTTTITVTINGRGSTRTVDDDDMYEFYEENKDVFECMSPTVGTMSLMGISMNTMSSQVRTTVDKEIYTPTITGVCEEYLDCKKQQLKKGRNLVYVDMKNNSKVCVVGAYYDYLYEDFYQDGILGQTIKINGNKYTVVGVVEGKEDESDYEANDTYSGQDNFIYIPYTTAAKQLMRNSAITNFTFLAKNEELVDSCVDMLKNRLYQTYQNENAYSVSSSTTIIDTMNDMVGIVVTVLSAIAAISLVVGGIGIMNIMLVSVTERTREIGIRKALGAKGKHIRLQFVIEAGTTSALGGLIGIACGIGAGTLVSSFIEGLTAVPTVQAVLIAFGVSVAIGVIFGYLPANKAAKLNPIEALRHD